MIIKNLRVTNFRNYKSQELKLSSGLNVLIGQNAQGKTNLLEAIYLAGVGKSPRTPRDKELIMWGETAAHISIEAQLKSGTNKIDIIIDKSQNKRIAINSLPISRMGELMGVVPTIFFAPSEIKIVKDAPSERRSFMDIALCQISRAYFYLLQRYNKILSQRNRLLKSGKADESTLDVWDMQLVSNGAKIIKNRKGFLKRLTPFAQSNHEFLTDCSENLSLSYDGFLGDTLEELTEQFDVALKKSRARDLELGYTHVGPQKDDIVIKVNSIDVRSFGSQGQLRTSALSLKLAELDLFIAETDEPPILLLDDVLSELDPTRRTRLLKKTQNLQTLLTCTNADKEWIEREEEAKVFKVEKGEIKVNSKKVDSSNK